MPDSIIDTVLDDFGQPIEFAAVGGTLTIRINEGEPDEHTVYLSARPRDQFARAYQEAERQAEANTANGQGSNGCSSR